MQKEFVIYGGYKYTFSQGYFRRGHSKTAERFLHRAVWVSVNGPIPDGHVIHHIDENTRNNSIENLQCLTIADHHNLHNTQMWEELKANPELQESRFGAVYAWRRSAEGRKFMSELNARNRAAGKYDNNDLTKFYAGRDAWVKSEECKEFNRQHMKSLIAQGKCYPPTKYALDKAAEWHSSEEGAKWHSENAKAMWKNKETHKKNCEVCGTEYETYYPSRSKFCGDNCRATALRRRRRST